MLRSMLSAGSAIRNHQTYMDVIANNIANVNTSAYKSMRVTFHELLSQVMNPGASPQGTRGGINPIQVGLGMTLGGIDGIFTQGAMQSTGRTSDLAVQGNGFFVFQGGTQNLYSRDGALDLGYDGSLVNTSTGLRIMGWNADAGGNIDPNAPLQPIMIPLNQGLAQGTQNVNLNGNLNAAASAATLSNPRLNAAVTRLSATTVAAGQTELDTGDYYVEIRNNGTTATPDWEYRLVDNSGNGIDIRNGATFDANWQNVPAAGTAADTGRGLTITFGTPTEAVDRASGTAASVHYVAPASSTNPTVTTNVEVFDSLGGRHVLGLTFTKTNTPNSWTWQISSTDGSITTATPTTPTAINFTNGGQFDTASPAASFNLTFSNGAAAQTVKLDFRKLTQLAQASELGVPIQDGYAPGQLTGFNVLPTGEVECNYANGMRKVLAQVALANFANPGGLLRVGDNMFASAANSGAANTGLAGTGGRGAIQAGYLEAANVDLAQQFTSMISAQRGFQANSRVISASDQMLQDLVNLVR